MPIRESYARVDARGDWVAASIGCCCSTPPAACSPDEPKARSRASSTRYGDIRVLLTTTDLPCSIPDFASLNPGYLLTSRPTVRFLALHNLPLVLSCRPTSWRDHLEQIGAPRLTQLRHRDRLRLNISNSNRYHALSWEIIKDRERETSMSAIRGSCLCGSVKFEITGPLSNPLNCHCSQCRKQHGAPFRSRVRVQAEDFRWLQGEHLITYYEGRGGILRGFCRECGSPIVNRPTPKWKRAAEFPGALSEYGVALAILDDDPPVRPACHVFVGSKARWFEITDDLPQYPEYAPTK